MNGDVAVGGLALKIGKRERRAARHLPLLRAPAHHAHYHASTVVEQVERHVSLPSHTHTAVKTVSYTHDSRVSQRNNRLLQAHFGTPFVGQKDTGDSQERNPKLLRPIICYLF